MRVRGTIPGRPVTPNARETGRLYHLSRARCKAVTACPGAADLDKPGVVFRTLEARNVHGLDAIEGLPVRVSANLDGVDVHGLCTLRGGIVHNRQSACTFRLCTPCAQCTVCT